MTVADDSADDAVLPVKPNRPKFDHQEQEFERNSILATDQWWFFRNDDEEYRQAMEEYGGFYLTWTASIHTQYI